MRVVVFAVCSVSALGACSSGSVPFISTASTAELAEDVTAATNDIIDAGGFASLDALYLMPRPASGSVDYAGGFSIPMETVGTEYVLLAGSADITVDFGGNLITGEVSDMATLQAAVTIDPGGHVVLGTPSDVRPLVGTLEETGGLADNGGDGRYVMVFDGDMTGDLYGVGPGTYAVELGSSGNFYTIDGEGYAIGDVWAEFFSGFTYETGTPASEDGLMVLRAK